MAPTELREELLCTAAYRFERPGHQRGAAAARLGEPHEAFVELRQLLGEIGDEGLARGILRRQVPGQLLDLAADRIEPMGEAARRVLAGAVERGPALVEKGQDPKSVVEGKRGSGRLDAGGLRLLKK